MKLHDYGCTLKAFKKEITKNIRLYGEMHRFIPAIASGMGVSIAEMKVNHRERKFGKSKYGISRTLRVILDLITVKFLLSYATRPIQIFGFLGVASGAIGFLLALFLTLQRQFMNIPISNRPMLLLAILLIFMGLQFITMGLLGEIMARIYHESQDKQGSEYTGGQSFLDGIFTQTRSHRHVLNDIDRCRKSTDSKNNR